MPGTAYTDDVFFFGSTKAGSTERSIHPSMKTNVL